MLPWSKAMAGDPFSMAIDGLPKSAPSAILVVLAPT